MSKLEELLRQCPYLHISPKPDEYCRTEQWAKAAAWLSRCGVVCVEDVLRECQQVDDELTPGHCRWLQHPLYRKGWYDAFNAIGLRIRALANQGGDAKNVSGTQPHDGMSVRGMPEDVTGARQSEGAAGTPAKDGLSVTRDSVEPTFEEDPVDGTKRYNRVEPTPEAAGEAEPRQTKSWWVCQNHHYNNWWNDFCVTCASSRPPDSPAGEVEVEFRVKDLPKYQPTIACHEPPDSPAGEDELPSIMDVRGIAPDATGDMSSEDWVRRLRSADNRARQYREAVENEKERCEKHLSEDWLSDPGPSLSCNARRYYADRICACNDFLGDFDAIDKRGSDE